MVQNMSFTSVGPFLRREPPQARAREGREAHPTVGPFSRRENYLLHVSVVCDSRAQVFDRTQGSGACPLHHSDGPAFCYVVVPWSVSAGMWPVSNIGFASEDPTPLTPGLGAAASQPPRGVCLGSSSEKLFSRRVGSRPCGGFGRPSPSPIIHRDGGF